MFCFKSSEHWTNTFSVNQQNYSTEFKTSVYNAYAMISKITSMTFLHFQLIILITIRLSGEKLCEVVHGFRVRWGFPQVVGAIDGTHIPITPEQDNRNDYYNRKGFYSIILQIVADYKFMINDICIGWPGKVHDARVLRNSQIFQQAQNNTLLPTDTTEEIDGHEVPLLILGDGAYPLLPWLITPYRNNGNLSDAQKVFNYQQSRARMVVENSIGRLKGRWRILMKRIEARLSNVPNIIAACCILHNVCEAAGEGFDEQWLDDGNECNIHVLQNENPNIEQRMGSATRLAITNYFAAIAE